MTTQTLTRKSSLEALAAIEAAIRVAFDEDDLKQGRHHPIPWVAKRLVDDLGLGADGNLGDDPEWLAMERRADELELEIRLGLPVT